MKYANDEQNDQSLSRKQNNYPRAVPGYMCARLIDPHAHRPTQIIGIGFEFFIGQLPFRFFHT